ncbi:MAG: segregation/condensation protein A [Pirellulales bacterium]|nr:segregation/condensation protein A [Pirellulales bacterium]
MKFTVELSEYAGPLDLLLYLVRKHELEVAALSLASIADQFVAHLDAIESIDLNSVGDFLDVAGTLTEMKSRLVLPRAEDETTIDTQEEDLIQRLLDYKRYKDAAATLDERAAAWRQRLPRLSREVPPRRPDLDERPVRELEVWDLVSAFARVIREHSAVQPTNIVYDETPISVYMDQIKERVATSGRVAFAAMFPSEAVKSSLVGLFLAMMELIRRHEIRVRQSDLFTEIWLEPNDADLANEGG